MAITIEELQVIVDAKVDKALAGLKKTEKASTGFKKSFLDMAKSVAGPIGAALIINKMVSIANQSAKLASSAAEIQSKFNVVFGNTASDVQKWADSYSESVGRSKTDTLDFLGSMGDLLKPLGFAKGAVDDLSKQAVKLGYDLGSFDNLNTSDVIHDIQSAMVGNFEVTKKYGVVLNETVVKQEAMNAGLWDGKGVLDAQSKAQAALNLIMKGTKDAQGDLIRTQSSAANVTRALEAAQKDLMIAIGKNVNDALTPMKSVLAGVITNMTKLIEHANAVSDAQDAVSSGTATSTQKILVHQATIKQLNDQLAQLNSLQGTNIQGIDAQKKAVEEQITAEKTAISEISRAQALQAQGDKAAKEAADKAAAAAEEAAKRKARIAAEQKVLDDAYDQTLQGQIDKQKEIIKEWESYVPSDKRTAVLKDAEKELDNLLAKQISLHEADKEGWLSEEDIAKQSLGNIDQWVTDFYAHQQQLKEDAVAATKTFWNNELTAAQSWADKAATIISSFYDYKMQVLDNQLKSGEISQEQYDKKRAAILTKQAKAEKAEKLVNIGIETAENIVKAFPRPLLMAAAAALGATEAGIVAATPIPKYATGGDFITDGPQTIMVGDNPGGQEQVSITPLSSPNINGPQGGTQRIIINLDGRAIADFITDASKNGDVKIYEGALI